MVHVVGMPASPAQAATDDIPKFERAIPATTGERATIRAKRECPDHVGVGAPGVTQGQSARFPYANFATPAGSRPGGPSAADGDCQDVIKGFGKDAVLDNRFPKPRILHLDALQVHPSQNKPRKIKATRVASQQAQQREQVRRAIPLNLLAP